MEIKLCNSQAEWEQALRLCSGQAKFLQSWEWGEFQEKTGKRVVRLLVAGEAVQGFEHKLPLLGRYLYLPRIKNQELRIMDELIKYCKENEYIFIRVEPLEELSRIPYPISRTKNRQPKQTLILDLTKSEEELLRQMHSKTRYNIHVAERQGVEIREERNADIFWELNSQTVARDKFKSHEKNYYEKMLSLPICRQLVAYYQGKAIASNILIVFGNTTTYLHGASANEYRNVMAPYLLQWEGMKLGKKLGCKFYDFWGVAPRGAANHPWAGVTRFKAGFGGGYREYPQAVDIVLKKWQYNMYQLLKKFL